MTITDMTISAPPTPPATVDATTQAAWQIALAYEGLAQQQGTTAALVRQAAAMEANVAATAAAMAANVAAFHATPPSPAPDKRGEYLALLCSALERAPALTALIDADAAMAGFTARFPPTTAAP